LELWNPDTIGGLAGEGPPTIFVEMSDWKLELRKKDMDLKMIIPNKEIEENTTGYYVILENEGSRSKKLEFRQSSLGSVSNI